jgi:hypothetical protein
VSLIHEGKNVRIPVSFNKSQHLGKSRISREFTTIRHKKRQAGEANPHFSRPRENCTECRSAVGGPGLGAKAFEGELLTNLKTCEKFRLNPFKPVFVDLQESSLRFQSRGRDAEFGCRTRRSRHLALGLSQGSFYQLSFAGHLRFH